MYGTSTSTRVRCACEWECVERGGFVGAGGFFVGEVERMTDEIH